MPINRLDWLRSAPLGARESVSRAFHYCLPKHRACDRDGLALFGQNVRLRDDLSDCADRVSGRAWISPRVFAPQQACQKEEPAQRNRGIIFPTSYFFMRAIKL